MHDVQIEYIALTEIKVDAFVAIIYFVITTRVLVMPDSVEAFAYFSPVRTLLKTGRKIQYCTL